VDVVDEAAAPAGFGACVRCRFVAGGSVAVCSRCAAAVLGSGPPAAPAGRAGAPWPPRAPAARRLVDVWATADYGPLLAQAIHRYKVGGRRGWARVFARLLLARLDELGDRARAYELIVASPTFVGVGGRSFDHIGLVLAWAQRQAPGRWPIAHEVVVRTRPAPALKDSPGWRRRLEVARTELRASLTVSEPERVRGRSVLVFDDVLTTGATCGEVARALALAGAERVAAIVLARQALRYPLSGEAATTVAAATAGA
jgi:predicted amidophosphoribosyltransferase